MDVSELRIALDEHGVSGDRYDLDLDGFTLPNDRYCLRREGKHRWITYYSERGQRIDEQTWITESEACNRLFHALVRDRGAAGDP